LCCEVVVKQLKVLLKELILEEITKIKKLHGYFVGYLRCTSRPEQKFAALQLERVPQMQLFSLHNQLRVSWKE
jgi:hypothetical protein